MVASLALTVVAALALVYALVGRAGVDRAPLRLAVLPFDASGVELPDTVYAEILFAEIIDRLVGSGAHLISAVATDRYAGFEEAVSTLRDDLDVDVVWLTLGTRRTTRSHWCRLPRRPWPFHQIGSIASCRDWPDGPPRSLA